MDVGAAVEPVVDLEGELAATKAALAGVTAQLVEAHAELDATQGELVATAAALAAAQGEASKFQGWLHALYDGAAPGEAMHWLDERRRGDHAAKEALIARAKAKLTGEELAALGVR